MESAHNNMCEELYLIGNYVKSKVQEITIANGEQSQGTRVSRCRYRPRIVCVNTRFQVTLGFVGVWTLASAHALCLPTNSVQVFQVGLNFQV